MRRAGFTLLEMIVAVAIMALAAGAAAMTFAKPLRSAAARQAVEQLCANDAATRQLVRTFDRPAEIVFNLEDQIVQRRQHEQLVFQFSMPRGCAVVEVRMGQQSFSDGQAIIPFLHRGLSQTYAVHIVSPAIDRWMIFAGLSGQVLQADDVAKVDEIFGATRNDAD
jgi:prepilin-type N-terminal cleavage/methylation domain-containing protein